VLGRRTSKVAGVAAVAAAALLAYTSPAMAAGGGVSTGSTTINETGTPAAPLCLQARSGAEIAFSNTGAFGVGTGTPFAGAWSVTFKAATGFYFGPAGVFTDNLCTSPALVPVAATSFSGGVSCSSLAGTYSRVNNAYVVQVSGSCTANGVTGSATVVFTGNQNPCLPTPEPCGSVPEMEGVYTQA
jgi:hypothetical protein